MISSNLSTFLIKSIALNISFYARGDEVPRRPPFLNQFTNFGRGDIQIRYFFKIEGMFRGMNPIFTLLVILESRDQGLWKLRRGRHFLRSRSSHDDKVTVEKKMLKILPGLNINKGISPHDEK